ncbi:MAG: OmpA family protein, partial [Chitinophagales bacterium]
FGDMDIYISFLQKNEVWTVPKNLGPVINTAATEGSVFIAADNRTLYIATNGRSGYGGFDMFMSKRIDDTWLNWSEPINLGPLINSQYDEFYYTLPASGEYAYYASRQNTIGGADLFRIQLPKEIQPEPVALIKGNVVDKESGRKINATIAYGGLINAEPNKIQTDTTGTYTLIIPEPSYFVTVTKEGYIPMRINPVEATQNASIDYNNLDAVEFIKHEIKQLVTPQLKNAVSDPAAIEEMVKESYKSLDIGNESQQAEIIREIVNELTTETQTETKYQELNTDIELIPIGEGQILTLNNVFFDANKSVLKDASKDQLIEIANFLKTNPHIYVEIGGHTNSLPEEAFCNQLSDARAKNVAEFIIEQGVSAQRVTYKGYGKTMPIADNITLEGRKKNQRVDLKIIKITE